MRGREEDEGHGHLAGRASRAALTGRGQKMVVARRRFFKGGGAPVSFSDDGGADRR
jgi:hypothetical protein